MGGRLVLLAAVFRGADEVVATERAVAAVAAPLPPVLLSVTASLPGVLDIDLASPLLAAAANEALAGGWCLASTSLMLPVLPAVTRMAERRPIGMTF